MLFLSAFDKPPMTTPIVDRLRISEALPRVRNGGCVVDPALYTALHTYESPVFGSRWSPGS